MINHDKKTWKRNKRREKFAHFYSDHSSMNKPKSTYGNIYRSAQKAGYSERYCHGNAHKLIEDVIVQKIIRINEEQWLKDHNITKEATIQIAWDNYKTLWDSGEKKEARLWMKEYGELSGHYIQKTETKVQVEHTEDQLKEIESIRASIQPSRISDN